MSLGRNARGKWLGVVLLAGVAAAASADVPVDRIPNSATLPARYPDSWVFVYTMPNKYEWVLGGFDIIDVAAESREYKGKFQGAFNASLIDPVDQGELYVVQSFLERAGQGPRTDVLTITDKSHLTATTSDIVLSKTGKRGFVEGNSVDLTHNRKFILSLNFTPASSVFVVDAQKRRLINEVPIPGCTSIYPTGAQGFSSLCENGTLTTFALGDKGQVVHESHTVAFNDIDHDVLWMEPVTTRAKTYFVSARGNVRPIDTTQSEVTVEPTWPLISKEEATDGWRTSGGLFTASDDAGRLYVRLYRDTGYAGQLKSNTEVWIFDPSNRTRILRIPLKNGATSIDVTRGPNPYLVVVADTDSGAEGSVDVYDAATGRFLRTIGGWLPGIALNLVQAKR